jgi:hypothetical protein
VRELFDSIDTDGSGSVDSEELRQVREGGGGGGGGGGGEREERVLVERSVDTKELRQVREGGGAAGRARGAGGAGEGDTLSLDIEICVQLFMSGCVCVRRGVCLFVCVTVWRRRVRSLSVHKQHTLCAHTEHTLSCTLCLCLCVHTCITLCLCLCTLFVLQTFQ